MYPGRYTVHDKGVGGLRTRLEVECFNYLLAQ